MAQVRFEISMSLDGFITGPNDSVDNGLGDGGERLHEWVVGLASWREQHGKEGGETGVDSDMLEERRRNVGATVMGRRMFDHGEGPWGDEPPFGVPVFVVTNRGRDPIPKQGGTTYHFVTDGIEAALAQARDAAGDKDVTIAGGANVIQQYLAAGLVDEFQIHVVPVLLGDGVRLFAAREAPLVELEKTQVIDSPAVTHLEFRPAAGASD